LDEGGSITKVSNIDSVIPMKEYASLNLTKFIERDPTFTLSGNVRSILNVIITPANQIDGPKYIFPLDKNVKLKVNRRLKKGDVIGDKIIEDIIPNYIMIENQDHWKYLKNNVGEYRDAVTNTLRINYTTDEGTNLDLNKHKDLMCNTCATSSIKYKTCSCGHTQMIVLGT
jgi:hypothetical protein